MSLENFGEPVTFVLSPIFTKFVSGRIVSGSRPLRRVKPSPESPLAARAALPALFSDGSAARAASGVFVSLGGNPFTDSASTLICAGVVPQHPPTKLSHPFSAHSFNCGASDSGVSGNPVGNNGFGNPAFG